MFLWFRLVIFDEILFHFFLNFESVRSLVLSSIQFRTLGPWNLGTLPSMNFCSWLLSLPLPTSFSWLVGRSYGFASTFEQGAHSFTCVVYTKTVISLSVGIHLQFGKYHKIPIISPALIFFQNWAFLLDLFLGELTSGRAYYWKEFCILKWVWFVNKNS